MKVDVLKLNSKDKSNPIFGNRIKQALLNFY